MEPVWNRWGSRWPTVALNTGPRMEKPSSWNSGPAPTLSFLPQVPKWLPGPHVGAPIRRSTGDRPARQWEASPSSWCRLTHCHSLGPLCPRHTPGTAGQAGPELVLLHKETWVGLVLGAVFQVLAFSFVK